MNIDKAGSQHVSAAVYDLPRGVLRDLPNRTDLISIDGDIASLGLAAATVHDECIPDERVTKRHTIFLQEHPTARQNMLIATITIL